MATDRYVVSSYTVKVGDTLTATWSGTQIKARGILVCHGPDRQRLIFYFLTDDSPVPAPVYKPTTKVGAVFLPFDQMPPYVDLVRNERPIYAYMNSDRAEWNNISSGHEPVGEEET